MAAEFITRFVTRVISGDMSLFWRVMHPDCRPVMKASGEVVVMELGAFAEALQALYHDPPPDYVPDIRVTISDADGDCVFARANFVNPAGTPTELRHLLVRCGEDWRIVQSFSKLG